MTNRRAAGPGRAATASAWLRAARSAPEDDPFARTLLPAWLRWTVRFEPVLRPLIGAVAPGAVAYHAVRSRIVDAELASAADHQIEQLVNLGAGLDTRSLRPGLHGLTHTFELDLPSMQRAKRRRLVRSGHDRREPVWVPADLDRSGWDDRLIAAGFDFGRPTLFLLEDVSYYLAPTALDRILSVLGRRGAPGSRLIFDYGLPSLLDPGAGRGAKGARLVGRCLGTPIRSVWTEATVRNLIESNGLTVVELLDPTAESSELDCVRVVVAEVVRPTG